MKAILVINNDFDTMSLIKKWLEKKATKLNLPVITAKLWG